jgi:hypothetical protein
MDRQRAQRFVEQWYSAWNAHDLDAILELSQDKITRYFAHYTRP